MEIELYYGGGQQSLLLPDGCDIEVLEGEVAPDADEGEIIDQGISGPLGAPPLEDFLDGGKLLIVTNDGFRPTPTERILGTFIHLIRDRPDTRILVGCGAHRPPTEEDYRSIFGRYWDDLRGLVRYHDARDRAHLVEIGRTSGGNEIRMNGLVDWADKILVTGSVEPHQFAGFTGGRKWVVGVAGFETIERNHYLALREDTGPLALEDNPIHRELVEWDRLVDRPRYCINVVQDRNLKVAACFAGDMDAVFEECVRRGMGLFASDTRGDADIVVSVARPPLDENLYQALRAQEYGARALGEGGILILMARCPRGIGPVHFQEMLERGNLEEIVRKAGTGYRLSHHKLVKLHRALSEGGFWIVTDLGSGVLGPVGLRGFGDVQDAVEEALGKMGKGARITIIPDGGMTVPRMM